MFWFETGLKMEGAAHVTQADHPGSSHVFTSKKDFDTFLKAQQQRHKAREQKTPLPILAEVVSVTFPENRYLMTTNYFLTLRSLETDIVQEVEYSADDR